MNANIDRLWEAFKNAVWVDDPNSSLIPITQRAVSTMRDHAPNQLARLLSITTRNLIVAATIIDWSKTLLACGNLLGFDEVCGRWDRGEDSAYSELRATRAFKELGFEVSLQPPSIGARTNDVLAVHGDENVYVEVLALEVSENRKRLEAAAICLNNALSDTSRSIGSVIATVELSNELSQDEHFAMLLPSILEKMTDLARSGEQLAFLEEAEISLRYFYDLVFHTGLTKRGKACSHCIRVNFARRIITNISAPGSPYRCVDRASGKRRQLNPEHTNLLFFNLTQDPDLEAMQYIQDEFFRPDRNTRIRGVVGYISGYESGITFNERFVLFRNPFATRPIPDRLQSLFNSIDCNRPIEGYVPARYLLQDPNFGTPNALLRFIDNKNQ